MPQAPYLQTLLIAPPLLRSSRSWDIDPAKLFAAPITKKEASPGARICQHLRQARRAAHTPSLHSIPSAGGAQNLSPHLPLTQEAQGCQYLILFLDCDREGENICFEVMESCVSVMRPVVSPSVLRAHFSAVTPAAIQAAMGTLGVPNQAEARAVDARQELDLKVRRPLGACCNAESAQC